MTAVDDLLQQIPMSQLAMQLGVDEATARSATQQALPALLGGMQANAQDPDGARSLFHAVEQHSSTLVDGGVDLDQVDQTDGQKIVGNVFGSNEGAVVNQLGGLGGSGGGGLMQKLLPILAPIVLSYLAQRLTNRSGATAEQPAGSGDLGAVLGGLLGGGGSAAGSSSGSLGGLGDLLGGLLGGGRR